MRGEPNPKQWEMYAANNCVHHQRMPPEHRYMRNWNRGYLQWSQDVGLRRDCDPIVIHIYSEFIQRFRLAAQGKTAGRQPPERLRERVARYFDPLPFWYPALEVQASDREQYPLAAVTQRPMAMYHSWDSQNAWLRQIHPHNELFVNPKTAQAQGIADGDWIWVESAWGKVRCIVPLQRGGGAGHGLDLECDRQGQGRLGPCRTTPTSPRKGFLLNHLISEELPVDANGVRASNSDPVTGQAGWYDVRVRIRKAGGRRAAAGLAAVRHRAGAARRAAARARWRAWFAGGQAQGER